MNMQGERCSKCGGSGIYVRQNTAYKCNCANEANILNRYERSQLPLKLRGFSFEKFELKYYPNKEYPSDNNKKSYRKIAYDTFAAAKSFAEKNIREARGKGILLCGNVGSGKTYLSSAVANYLIQGGQEVLFVVVPDLLDEIRASYSGDTSFTEIELLRRARDVPVLILDDLGAHNYTDWSKNKIYSILNSRLNHELPVVINSNLVLEEMEFYLGERTTSRLVELCDTYRLIVPKDIRHIRHLERRK